LDIHQHHQRALCPRLTHGSLDLQRNDRLGRRRSHQRFEHRREILRAIQRDADANSNCDGHSYGYSDGDAYAYAYAHPYTYTYCYANRYCHTYAYFDASADTDAED